MRKRSKEKKVNDFFFYSKDTNDFGENLSLFCSLTMQIDGKKCRTQTFNTVIVLECPKSKTMTILLQINL